MDEGGREGSVYEEREERRDGKGGRKEGTVRNGKGGMIR